METYGFIALIAAALATWLYAFAKHNYALLTGAVVAAGLHAAALLPGDLFGRATPAPSHEETPIVEIEPPPILPEEKDPEPAVPPIPEPQDEQVVIDPPPPVAPERLGLGPDIIFGIKPSSPPPPVTDAIRTTTHIPIDSRPKKQSAKDLVDISQLTNPPEATYRIEPAYPHALRQTGVEGTVVLGFVVDRQGRARDIVVIESTHRDFEQPAIDALKRWQFKPGRKDGRVVAASNVRQTIQFGLRH